MYEVGCIFHPLLYDTNNFLPAVTPRAHVYRRYFLTLTAAGRTLWVICLLLLPIFSFFQLFDIKVGLRDWKEAFFFFFSPTVSCTPAPPPTGWSAKRLLKKGYPICRQAAAGAPADDAYTNQRTNTSWLDVDNDFGGSCLFQVGIILRACLRVYFRGIHLGPNYSMPCLKNQKYFLSASNIYEWMRIPCIPELALAVWMCCCIYVDWLDRLAYFLCVHLSYNIRYLSSSFWSAGLQFFAPRLFNSSAFCSFWVMSKHLGNLRCVE